MLEIFKPSAPLWTVLLRTAIIYIVILAGLRLTGKREMGQMTVFDLTVLLLLSNAVQNAMTGPDTSIPGGLVAAAVLLSLDVALARLRLRLPRLRRLLEGSPTLLILRGEIIERNLRREGVDRETLMTALREHGVDKVGDVEIAVLEIDGTISVVPVSPSGHRVRRRLRYIRRG